MIIARDSKPGAPVFEAQVAALRAETGPDERDVAELTYLLDIMGNFSSNEQRARYLLSCNWMRELKRAERHR
jgi:hypothetical protein